MVAEMLLLYALPCGPHAAAVSSLRREYDERVAAVRALDDGKAAALIFASPSGTWTAVVSTADGISCVVASGHEWPQPQGEKL